MVGRKHLLFMWFLLTVSVYVIWILIYYKNVAGPQKLKTDDLDLWKNNSYRRNSTEVKNKTCNVDDFVLEPDINQTDPCFVAFFRKKMLIPPRSFVSVKTIGFDRKEVDVPSNIEKLKWVVALLVEGAPVGTQFFFVDAGANDGRFLSSTLRLETMYGWNGVLIEPLQNEFEELLTNRKAWAVNAPLCVTPYPKYLNFFVQGYPVMPGPTNQTSIGLPCVPLYTILTALNINVVDYLSLDIEGAELQVLNTVPYDKVKFKIMAIEYNHLPGSNPVGQLEDFLKPKGYKLVAIISRMDKWAEDCVFVHESVYLLKYSMIQYVIKNQKLINSVLLDDVRIKAKS